MKVLIIEDEPKTLAFLKRGFTEEGFVADVASDGVDGLHLATTGGYDLVVLDVMMPKRDGWAVLQEIRNRNQSQAVIMLTALDSVACRVKGLELGADDYLIKPFAFSELNARARSVLRRGQARVSEILQFADLRLDLLRHKVSRAGSELDLAPQEYRLLEYFLRHPGEVLTRTRIAEQVWDINFDGDSNVVDAAVRRVRRKVDDPYDLKLVHTIRGVGYVLEERK
jgi:two-component system copper resistance phosphate regulon response regulator CusR